MREKATFARTPYYRVPFWVRVTAMGALAAGVLTGCGSQESTSSSSEATSAASSEPARPSSSLTPPLPSDTAKSYGESNKPAFIFNARGSDVSRGGSKIITVYRGASESDNDRTMSGTFPDGQIVKIECHTEGREVKTHPEQGEKSLASKEWYKVTPAENGPEFFATAAYGDALLQGQVIPAQQAEKLTPHC